MSLNVYEYGNVFRFNAGTDISATTPTLILEPRYGKALEKTVTDGVTIPVVDVTVNGVTFLQNEYVEYTFKDGDLTIDGRWRAKLKAKFSPTKELITNYQRFTVMP